MEYYWIHNSLTVNAKEISGSLTGNKKEVISFLKSKNLKIITLKFDFNNTLKSLLNSKKINSKVLSFFFDELKDMLETGIGINEAIIALKETNNDFSLIKALDTIYDNTYKGYSLVDSFRKTKAFSWLVYTTIDAGEKAGNLPDVLNSLAQHYKKADERRSKILSAVSYPAFVFVVLLGVMGFVSIYVIPKLKDILPDSSKSSILTNFMIGFSIFIKNYWFLIILIVIGIIFTLFHLSKKYPVKLFEFYYKIPLFGQLLKERDLSFYFFNLSILQYAGVNLNESLNLLYKANNNYIGIKFKNCLDYICGGSSFWEAIKNDSYFPKYVYFTVRKGEEQGNFAKYFNNIAIFYSNRVDQTMRKIIGTIQPALIIFCFIFLGLTAGSFLLPIYANLANIAGGGL